MKRLPTRLPSPRSLILVTLVLLVPWCGVSAEVGRITPNEVERGSLLLHDDDGRYRDAPLVDTDVSMVINGMIARVTVRQTFGYRGRDWVNGIYVFPLPETAAVDRLRMHVGERVIEGQIQARETARKIFDAARKAGKKASLVEQQRANLFTTSVANIGPGETVTVEIAYQQTVAFERGEFSLRFPLTTGIRYIPGEQRVNGFDGGGWSFNTSEVPDASSITPPVTAAGEGHDNPVTIAIDIDAGMPLDAITSSYHRISTRETGTHRYAVSLAQGPVPADRDFELRYRPPPAHAPRAALFRQAAADSDGAESDYGLLMLMPPEASLVRDTASPREVIYVIDTSGSMSGTSITQARAALLYGLERLRPQDSFNVIQFNSSAWALHPQAMPANAANLARARAWVNGLHADGGTEMRKALALALDGREQHERLRQVIFLTDGSVGNEAALFRVIDQRLGASRLFTVGIGAAPNSLFMREAATHGRGSFTYIGDVAEVQEKMRALFEKLEFPVLADIRVTSSDGEVSVWPDPVRDLYVHEPLVVSLRLRHASELTISGRLGNRPWSTTVPLTGGAEARGLDVAWARERIASLERSLARGAAADDVRAAITALGLRHHIVTRHTSLVAVDVTPSRPAETDSRDAQVAAKKPAGWQMSAPAARLPQTATPMLAHAFAGIVIGLAGLLLGRRRGAR